MSAIPECPQGLKSEVKGYFEGLADVNSQHRCSSALREGSNKPPAWSQIPTVFHSATQARHSPVSPNLFISQISTLQSKEPPLTLDDMKNGRRGVFPQSTSFDLQVGPTFRNGLLSINMLTNLALMDSNSFDLSGMLELCHGMSLAAPRSDVHVSSPPPSPANRPAWSMRSGGNVFPCATQGSIAGGKQAGHGNAPVDKGVKIPTNIDCWTEINERLSALVSELRGNAEACRKEAIYDLRGADAQCLVDALNRRLIKERLSDTERRHTLRLLCKIAKQAQVYPKSCELSGVHCSLTRPMNEGGFGCIYKGDFRDKAVCVKAVRIYARKDNRRTLRAHAGELALWAHLSHPNILPFYGVYLSNEAVERICIVSPWMEYGDLLRYMSAFPESPKIPLISDIISGLQYLHDLNIIHGDLKASNVLISNNRQAMLADFGISHISMTLATTSTRGFAGTANWTAPELLLEEDESEPIPTKKSDIWSFSCTCYEVLTGEMPFYHIKKVVQLIRAMLRGVRPMRTTLRGPCDSAEEQVWTLMEMCWNYEPEKRPDTKELKYAISKLDHADNHSVLPGSSSLIWENVKSSRAEVAIDYYRLSKILHWIEKVGGSERGRSATEIGMDTYDDKRFFDLI
ncbi:hypothetical protein NP233_g1894 [Leucocoprinus birnbaumii]|uniref:Protein kinase domain-containing protein n=1 Tax=Leucocoprinus birnbaumii TaxID=56174 RepID=A0AAD5W032_9AGAR|nr:hypothetical protein NP233_g1894 [Leucocoprinus birnbaumii]